MIKTMSFDIKLKEGLLKFSKSKSKWLIFDEDNLTYEIDQIDITIGIKLNNYYHLSSLCNI